MIERAVREREREEELPKNCSGETRVIMLLFDGELEGGKFECCKLEGSKFTKLEI